MRRQSLAAAIVAMASSGAKQAHPSRWPALNRARESLPLSFIAGGAS